MQKEYCYSDSGKPVSEQGYAGIADGPQADPTLGLSPIVKLRTEVVLYQLSFQGTGAQIGEKIKVKLKCITHEEIPSRALVCLPEFCQFNATFCRKWQETKLHKELDDVQIQCIF